MRESLSANDEQLAAAGAHFLQVALELLEQRVVGRHRHHRHLGGDERQRAVLELARRVGLGVDVADLLELQRAFERDRVVQAAAEEERVLLAREAPRTRRSPAARAPARPAAPTGRWRSAFRCIASCSSLRWPRTWASASVSRNSAGELRGEGLGRRDADLDAGAGDVGELALAHHRARRDVADRQRVRHAERARVLQRRQRVGRLAALR